MKTLRVLQTAILAVLVFATLGVSGLEAQGPEGDQLEGVPGLIFPPYGSNPYRVRKIDPTNNSWGVHGNRSYDGLESWFGTDFQGIGGKTLHAPFGGQATKGSDPNGGNWVAVWGSGEWVGWFARYLHLEAGGRATGRVAAGDPIGTEAATVAHSHLILLKCRPKSLDQCRDVPILTLILKPSWPQETYAVEGYREGFAPKDTELFVPEGASPPSWDQWLEGDPAAVSAVSGSRQMQQVLVTWFWKKFWNLVDQKRIPVPVVLRQQLEGELTPTLNGWAEKIALGALLLAAFVITGSFLVAYLLARHVRMRRDLERGIRREWRPIRVGFRKAFFWLAAAMLLAWKIAPGDALTRWWWSQLALIAGVVWLTFRVEHWLLGPVGHFLGSKSKRNLQRFLEGWLYQILAWGVLVPLVLVNLLFATGWFFYTVPEEATGGWLAGLLGKPAEAEEGPASSWETGTRPGAPSLWASSEAPILPPVALTWWNGQNFTLSPPRKVWEDIWVAGRETGADPVYSLCLGSSESQRFWTVTGCSSAGACGPYQFMAGTWPVYQPWPGASRIGWPDSVYGADKMIVSLRLDRQPTKAVHGDRFTGSDGGLAWNVHRGQANYVWDCVQTVEAAIAEANR